MGYIKKQKSSFVFEYSWNEDVFKWLTNEDAGALIKAMIAYEIDGEIADLPSALKMPYRMICRQLDINKEKYKQRCEENAEKGRRSAETRKAKNTETEDKESTTVNHSQPELTKLTDNDNDSGNDNDNDIDIDSDSGKGNGKGNGNVTSTYETFEPYPLTEEQYSILLTKHTPKGSQGIVKRLVEIKSSGKYEGNVDWLSLALKIGSEDGFEKIRHENHYEPPQVTEEDREYSRTIGINGAYARLGSQPKNNAEEISKRLQEIL